MATDMDEIARPEHGPNYGEFSKLVARRCNATRHASAEPQNMEGSSHVPRAGRRPTTHPSMTAWRGMDAGRFDQGEPHGWFPA